MRSLLIVAIAALVVCATSLAVPALADWDQGDPAKWVQLPDLTPTGIDIDTDGCSIIADDWLCTSIDPITDVHLWGSWLGDVNKGLFNIRLRIWSDMPGPPFSHPNTLLWTGNFKPLGQTGADGYFTERLYYTLPQGEHEMFWKPNSNPEPMGQDTQVWQYNIYIDPLKAFWQEGTVQIPKVYWLEVLVQPNGEPSDFGWKTSYTHWNDDAVYFDQATMAWKPLEYPIGYSLDMAFVLTVPEPSALLALLVGLGGIAWRKRK